MDLPPFSLEEILRNLAYQSKEPDSLTLQQIQDCQDLLRKVASPRFVHQIFPISWEEGGARLEGTTLLLPGNSIRQLLAQSHHCHLLALTLGQEVDRTLRQLQVQDMAKAVIFDACANHLVEECCNSLEETLHKACSNEEHPCFFTDRFSPGYGDLPLALQAPLALVLDSGKKAGISVSATHLLSPLKSITALLGLADSPQPMRIKGCGHCQLQPTCPYRKGGTTCGT